MRVIGRFETLGSAVATPASFEAVEGEAAFDAIASHQLFSTSPLPIVPPAWDLPWISTDLHTSHANVHACVYSFETLSGALHSSHRRCRFEGEPTRWKSSARVKRLRCSCQTGIGTVDTTLPSFDRTAGRPSVRTIRFEIGARFQLATSKSHRSSQSVQLPRRESSIVSQETSVFGSSRTWLPRRLRLCR